MEGSRKFWTQVLGLIAIWVLAKFGPSWGGIFQTYIPVMAVAIGSVGYFLYNYVQKTTADVFVPDNWLAGKRTILGLLLTILAPVLTSLSVEGKDVVTQMITYVADAGVPFLYMLFQTLSDKKLAAGATVTISTTAQPIVYYPPSIPTVTTTEATPIPTPGNTMKDDLKTASAVTASWEGAKSFLLGTFKDRFEAALARYASLSMSTIEAVRRAVQDVTGVCLDEKTCQALGQQPGFLGAMSASMDITIVSDLFTAIDKTPELGYMKAPFIKIAVRYTRKAILDGVVKKVQSGVTETMKAALLYTGMSLYQVEKTIPELPGYMWYSTMPNVLGTYSFRPFDIYVLAGVDSNTMEDL